ncbi:MAG: oligopeptide/dipeptide ABC transporter ATP-binding protein [Armatimonadota bacterium]
MPILEVRNLHVAIEGVEILRGVNLFVEEGETLGIVGESGCGKSMTGLAVIGLLPGDGRVTQGEVLLNGENLVTAGERRMRHVRGGDIAMVFQDPFTSLNPAMRIGDQIAEAMVLHRSMSWRAARKEAVKMLESVKVPAPASTVRKYPHQLSGGQRQRVMVAMAFACRPKVLIADEPTTALDVTLQAQILALLTELQEQEGTAVILISHDIGVIGSVSDRICVFYAGRVIEDGDSRDVLRRPKHPYTQGLLASLPGGEERLSSIPGQPPDFRTLGGECAFAPRCPHRFERCDVEPDLLGGDLDAAKRRAVEERRSFIDLTQAELDAGIVWALPEEVARRHLAIPIRRDGTVFHVAMAEPDDETARQEVAKALGARILPSLASSDAIMAAIERIYGGAPMSAAPHRAACWLVERSEVRVG